MTCAASKRACIVQLWNDADSLRTASMTFRFDRTAGKVRLVWQRIFQPGPEDLLDFDATNEKTLLELCRRFTCARCASTTSNGVKRAKADRRERADAGNFPVGAEVWPRRAAFSTKSSRLKASWFYRWRGTLHTFPRCSHWNLERVAHREKEGSHRIDLLVALVQAAECIECASAATV